MLFCIFYCCLYGFLYRKNIRDQLFFEPSENRNLEKRRSYDAISSMFGRLTRIEVHPQFYKLLENSFEVSLSQDTCKLIYKNRFIIYIKIDAPYDKSTYEIKPAFNFTNINSFKLSNRFMVVFAEEQTILEPEKCIQLLMYIFESMYKLHSIDPETINLQKVKSWSRETAHLMASHRFRESYLDEADLNRYKYLKNLLRI